MLHARCRAHAVRLVPHPPPLHRCRCSLLPCPDRLPLVAGAILTFQYGGARCNPDRPRQGTRMRVCARVLHAGVTSRGVARRSSPSPLVCAALQGMFLELFFIFSVYFTFAL